MSPEEFRNLPEEEKDRLIAQDTARAMEGLGGKSSD
jgi:hypothetical protein